MPYSVLWHPGLVKPIFVEWKIFPQKSHLLTEIQILLSQPSYCLPLLFISFAFVLFYFYFLIKHLYDTSSIARTTGRGKCMFLVTSDTLLNLFKVWSGPSLSFLFLFFFFPCLHKFSLAVHFCFKFTSLSCYFCLWNLITYHSSMQRNVYLINNAFWTYLPQNHWNKFKILIMVTSGY